MGRKAIVVGATSGIGREVALLLADQGWTVGVAGRRKDRLETLLNSHKGITAAQCIDVNDSMAPQHLAQLIADLGGMDLYFHSSGIGWQNEQLDPQKELSTVETNALGFTRMVTAAFRYFAEHGGGHIAGISSIAGTKGLGAAPAYSATKRFQSHYLESLSQLARMRNLHIRITDIRPGFVATDLISDSNYPLQLSARSVASAITKAIGQGREIRVIDFRYRILVAIWRLIPRVIWVRLRIK